MTPSPNPSVATLTPAERAYIRREFHQFFSTFPTVAEGFQLKTWRAGPKQGQPKLPPAAESLVARGLMCLDVTIRPPRLFFTEAGLAALRVMMADRRLANPVDFGHVRQELGHRSTRPGRSCRLKAARRAIWLLGVARPDGVAGGRGRR